MPEAAQDAELLTAAAVALNRHAPMLRELGSAFDAAGHELYLVGGSVRDAVLGRLSPDLDFATDARPEQVQQILRRWADNCVGHRNRFRHRRRWQGRPPAGNHHVPR